MAQTREAALQAWVEEVLGTPVAGLAPVSGDASFRRYFRAVEAGRSHIAVDAPPEHEDSRPFLGVAERLRSAGLHVPEVRAADLEQGFLLLSDLGDTLYLSELDAHSADRLYGAALEALLRMQAAPAEGLPPYDAALLGREMGLFREWYLGRHLGWRPDAGEERALEDCFGRLAEEALAQPRVFVHRDYHSRNLMVADPNPGIIDFQDAVHGPITYDLVSLLRDCYIAWPEERVAAWVADYQARAEGAGLLEPVPPATFRRWFDWMGVQRHLKAAGIFARLNHRDGKPGYLRDIPRTLGYIRQVCARYPELEPLGDILERLPAQSAATG